MPDPQAPTSPTAPAQGRPATWEDVIRAEAKARKIPADLAMAIAHTESSLNPNAKSPKGAIGLMQLMPDTAKRLGVDPADPMQNIRGGLTELRRLLDENGGNVDRALRLYNGSPQASPAATEPYVQSVMGRLTGQPAKPSLGRLQVGQPPSAALGGEPEPQVPALPTWKPGAIPKPPEVPGLNVGQHAVEIGGEIASSFNPMSREGRRNIAGGVGAAGTVAGALALAPETGGLSLAALGTLGAGAGGALAETGEQMVGTDPMSIGKIALAGGQQAAYEAIGQGFVWPIKALGRRVIASRVGRAAAEGLDTARAATMAKLDTALAAASATAGDVKALAAQTVRFARRQAGDALRSARTIGKEGVQQAESTAESRLASATEPYTSMVAKPPSTAAAGRMAQRVIEGPATEARDLVGKEVEAAAKSGPDIDITELKAEAQAILDRIAKPQRTFPRGTPEEAAAGEVGDLLPGGAAATAQYEREAAAGSKTAAAILAARQKILSDQANVEALAAAQKTASEEVLKHPALGVISRILNAEDIVPFHDAHLWKSELQNGLAGTYDKAVKKQVTSITQKLTGSLRGALAVHEPYNEATAAYAQIVPLYTKEYAARLKRTALTDPESLIRMINPGKPTAARMLRDVLVGQSAQGGDAQGGQRAWDLVRSAWTHQHVLKGGIEKLDANLAKLPEEFSSVFYGDQSGQAVLQNLRQIASAYKAAAETGAADVVTAKGAKEAGVESARRMGESRIEQATQESAQVSRMATRDIAKARLAKRVAKAPTTEETKFANSSLIGQQATTEQLVAHGMRAFFLGPTKIWGALSWMKLLTGPKERDLLEWAAYSPANTQRLIKLMTGPSPTGMAIADLLRAAGVLGAPEESKSQVGQPPPR